MQNRTPLRYPGGKSMMTPFFVDLFRANGLSCVSYAEPYAGGAGAAINLLLGEYVEHILINDANPAIFSFWKYVTEDNQRFVDEILNCKVNLTEWEKMHNLIKSSSTPSFELGFAAFFLSRTNRSGILNAGPIGGNTQAKQDAANYKIDCRFNKKDMAKRVEDIGRKSSRITVTNKDAIQFLQELKSENLFVYLDPPYFKQGKSLYLDYYKPQDHIALAEFLRNTDQFNWILSYDCVDEIKEIYSDFDLYTFELNYTAQQVRTGKELLIHSRQLTMPSTMNIARKRTPISVVPLAKAHSNRIKNQKV